MSTPEDPSQQSSTTDDLVIDQLSLNDTIHTSSHHKNTTTTTTTNRKVSTTSTSTSTTSSPTNNNNNTNNNNTDLVHHVALPPKPTLFERIMGETTVNRREALHIKNVDEFHKRQQEYSDELARQLGFLPDNAPSNFLVRKSLELQRRVRTSFDMSEFHHPHVLSLEYDPSHNRRISLDSTHPPPTIIHVNDDENDENCEKNEKNASSSRQQLQKNNYRPFSQLTPEEKKQACISAAKLSLQKYMGEGWLDSDKQHESTVVHVHWFASKSWFHRRFITVTCHITAFQAEYDQCKTFVDLTYTMHMDQQSGEMKTFEMVYKEMEVDTYFEQEKGNSNKK